MRRLAWMSLLPLMIACQRSSFDSRVVAPTVWTTVDAGRAARHDAGERDASNKHDAGPVDAGPIDAAHDAKTADGAPDAGSHDAASADAGADATDRG
jgi:hypothetical protein